MPGLQRRNFLLEQTRRSEFHVDWVSCGLGPWAVIGLLQVTGKLVHQESGALGAIPNLRETK